MSGEHVSSAAGRASSPNMTASDSDVIVTTGSTLELTTLSVSPPPPSSLCRYQELVTRVVAEVQRRRNLVEGRANLTKAVAQLSGNLVAQELLRSHPVPDWPLFDRLTTLVWDRIVSLFSQRGYRARSIHHTQALASMHQTHSTRQTHTQYPPSQSFSTDPVTELKKVIVWDPVHTFPSASSFLHWADASNVPRTQWLKVCRVHNPPYDPRIEIHCTNRLARTQIATTLRHALAEHSLPHNVLRLGRTYQRRLEDRSWSSRHPAPPTSASATTIHPTPHATTPHPAPLPPPPTTSNLLPHC